MTDALWFLLTAGVICTFWATRFKHKRPGRLFDDLPPEILAALTNPGTTPQCPVWLMLDAGCFHARCESLAGHLGDHQLTFTTLRSANLSVRPF